MKRQFARDFFTGLTALGGVAGIIVMLAIFGELREVGQRYYTFHLKMPSAGGLTTTSRVTLNGVRIGTIVGIANAPDPTRGVELALRVREGVRIPESFEVYIDKTLVGDASLDLILKPGAAPEANFVDPGEVIERDATGLFDRISEAIREPLERMSRTADNIDQLAATYTQVGAQLNTLLEPRTPQQVEAGAAPNIRSAIARADAALAGANRWLGDERLRSGIIDVTDKASGVLAQASDTAGAWRRTAETLDRQAGDAGQKLGAVADQAAGTLRRIDDAAAEVAQLASAINEGQGTFGQLAQNPDLYNAVRDAAKRLERALAEFQLMVEKYKAEGIPLKL